MGIKVIKGGLLTTIQDLGRSGYRKDGIIVSGAMDSLALRIGNLLLGNKETEAGIECTLHGPELLFESDQLIAITGGDLSPLIDGVPVKMWRPVIVRKGSVLNFGAAINGCRAYLTISGGIDIPEILGSRSTYLRAGFGGWNGRALKNNDVIAFKSNYNAGKQNFNWSFDLKMYPDLNDRTIRAIKGPEFGLFTENSRNDFFNGEYAVTKEADRMGYRLQGPSLNLDIPEEMLSSAVAFGTVQVTNQGNPIILMADHQTVGGYPRIAQVITCDLSKLGQLQSGKNIRFKLITLAEAQALLSDREQQIKQLKQTLTFKYKS